MKSFVATLAGLLAVSSTVSGQCTDFAFGKCNFNDEDVLSTWNIPNLPEATNLCQQLCQVRAT